VMLDNEPDEDGERGVIINTSSVAGEDGTAACSATPPPRPLLSA
jgi:hypothetical protein